MEPIGDCEALYNGVCIFTTVKVKAPVTVSFAAVAVDDCCSYNVGIVWICAAEPDGLACEINIPVSLASVRADTDQNHITIIGIVNCSLDVVEF